MKKFFILPTKLLKNELSSSPIFAGVSIASSLALVFFNLKRRFEWSQISMLAIENTHRLSGERKRETRK